MLDMNENRLSYLEQLRPLPDYSLNYAVATTYSLDMGALLAACMALSGHDSIDDPYSVGEMELFAEVENVADKLVVFCEKGRIANEDRTNRLCILFEGIINQAVVKGPDDSGYVSPSSFHAKTWMLEYVNDSGDHQYRLLVLSRNLTFDTSWDVAVLLEGSPENRAVESSANVARFLRYLAQSASTDVSEVQRNRLMQLAEAVTQVRFRVADHHFSDFRFLPFGPDETGLLSATEEPLLSDDHQRLMILSPFLSNSPKGMLGMLRDRRIDSPGEDLLLSREDSLARLDARLRDSFQCYAPQPWLSDVALENDGVQNSDDGDSLIRQERQRQGYSQPHAKVYLLQQENRQRLYLGSLNATYRALYDNVEAMMRFDFESQSSMSFDSIVDELVGDGKPFGEFTMPTDPDFYDLARYDQVQQSMDNLIHDAAKAFEFRAVHVAASNGAYDLVVDCQFNPSFDSAEVSFFLSPYLCESKRQQLGDTPLVFRNLLEDQISSYFVLTAQSSDQSASVIISCPPELFHDELLPHDERLKNLLRHIMSTDSLALPRYLNLVFKIPSYPTRKTRNHRPLSSESRAYDVIGSGIYEQLLRSLGDRGQALEKLEHAKKMLAFLPTEFHRERAIETMNSLITAFEKAVQSYDR